MPDKEESTQKPSNSTNVDDKSAVAKGKAKAADQSDSAKDASKDKDGKAADGDKLGLPEELSEEDQKLKDDLDMLVERLLEDDQSLYKSTLDAIKESIKTSTSSMTAVPKPLKFLRPHYESLTKAFDRWPAGDDKNSLADTLSVLGMTHSDESRRETLKYRLYYPSDDLGSWGHEYMRHLALEIGAEYLQNVEEDKNTEEIEDLALSLVPFFLKNNAEADAVDLISDLDMIEKIPQFLDKDTYSRVCLYMVSMVPLLAYPDNNKFLQTAYEIYKQHEQYTQALVLAIRLNDLEKIEELMNAAANDQSVRRQMAYILGRQKVAFPFSEEDEEEDPALISAMSNTQISDFYRNKLATDLSIQDPKTPEDIYKTHLENSRPIGIANADSHKANLASVFVNAFVNLGFCKDTLLLVDDNKESLAWRVKDNDVFSSVGSLGVLLEWQTETSLDILHPYTEAKDDSIKAGALLAMGIAHSGVKDENDPILALLSDPTDLNHGNGKIRLACIMGMGIAYAGSEKDVVLDLLLPIVQDTGNTIELSAMAALSLGLVFVGSAQGDVLQAIIQNFMDEDRASQLEDKWMRFMTLAIGLLCFGRQEEVEVIIETLKAIDHPVSKASQVLAEVCAWAGTGAVLKLQELLHMCNEQIGGKGADEEESKETNAKEDAERKSNELCQSYAVLGLALVAMGEDIGQDMILRQFGHLMHYGANNIRKVVPLAMALVSPSYPQMKVYDTLSRYSHDNDIDVAINAIFAMGLLGAGTNNARLAQLLRQLASYYQRQHDALFMVRIAQGLLHMGKGTLTVNPFHTDRQVLSRVSAAGLLTVMIALIDCKDFIFRDAPYLLYYLTLSAMPRWLMTLDENLDPITVNVRVGQAVDVVGQAGRPKTITGWQTQSTPVLLAYGERAELEDEQYISVASTLEGVVILKKNPEWTE